MDYGKEGPIFNFQVVESETASKKLLKMKTYSVHGLLLILLIGWGEAALTRNVMTGRSEQRPSSERISQGESSTPNTAQPDSEQPTKNSKEGIVGPVVGAYGGYTGNHAHPIGMSESF